MQINTPQKYPPTSGRLLSLDLLRFIAVMMVLLRHMTPENPNPWIGRVTSAGWAGVDMFFVLSGFLIGNLLIGEANRNGSIDLRRFYIRRSMKIYPAFLVLVVIYGSAEYLLGSGFTWHGLIGELTFTQNYLWHIFNHTWSLAVEEHFYLLIGVFLLALCRRQAMDRLPALGLMVLAGCFLCRLITFLKYGSINMFASHLRMDSLMAGVLLAWTQNYYPEAIMRVRRSWGYIAIAMLMPLLWLDPTSSFYSTVGFTLNYLAFSIVLVVVLSGESYVRRSAILRFVALLGSYSYTTYLWHMLVKRSFSMMRQAGVLDLGWLGEFIGYSVASFGVGYLMAQLSEKPVLTLRDRFFPSASP